MREWEHLRTELESFPEFVALVASVHHMPPTLKTLALEPCYPHRKKDTSRHADILGVEENTNLCLLE